MSGYFGLKLVHILSATLLFGTGLGSAFFMWMAHRRGDVAAIAVTARHVVLADWLFTTPAVLVQPLTGFLLLQRLGIDWQQPWVLGSLLLYLVAGLCWLPVVAIQLRVRRLAERAHADATPLPSSYFRWMRWWFWLGWPAFAAVLAILALMVFKPTFQ